MQNQVEDFDEYEVSKEQNLKKNKKEVDTTNANEAKNEDREPEQVSDWDDSDDEVKPRPVRLNSQ